MRKKKTLNIKVEIRKKNKTKNDDTPVPLEINYHKVKELEANKEEDLIRVLFGS